MGSTTDIYKVGVSEFKQNPILIVPVLASIALSYGANRLFVSQACTVVQSQGRLVTSCDRTGYAGLIIFTILSSLVMFCWVAAMISQVLESGSTSMKGSLGLAGRRLPSFLLTYILMGCIFFGEFIAGAALARGIGPGGFLVMTLAFVVTFFLLIFTPFASIYNELGPVAAMADSIRVIRFAFRRVFRLCMLTLVLGVATGLLMDLFYFTGLSEFGFLSLGNNLFGLLVWIVFTRAYAEIAWEKYDGGPGPEGDGTEDGEPVGNLLAA